MLVDDDDANNFYSNILIQEAACSCQVKTKTSVNEAFEYISGTGYMTKRETESPFPELIFLDINMPVKDGWDFLEHYKKMKAFLVKLPVIIMISSSCNPQDKIKAESIPEVADIYDKPLTSEIINTVLFKYFPDYW